MEIIQAYQTKNPSYARNRSIKPVGILVHATGAVNRDLKRYVDSPERLGKNQYNNHWNKDTATKSMHAFIGYDKDKQVIVAETLPPDRACWGCGKGPAGSYNYDPQAHLQFEICQGSNTDVAYYHQAITCAEEYCAHLCRLYGWDANRITSHYEAHDKGYASNHGDPRSWMVHFGDSMDKFRARVQTLLDSEAEMPENSPSEPPAQKVEEIPTPENKNEQAKDTEGKPVQITLNTLRNGSKGEQVKTLQRLLNEMGHPCGKVDGIMGAKTVVSVKAFQKAEGLEADGIVGKNTWTALLT